MTGPVSKAYNKTVPPDNKFNDTHDGTDHAPGVTVTALATEAPDRPATLDGDVQSDGRRARGLATREAILDVATRHFARHGYRRTLLEGVAADAGVSKGLIRFHFASKDGLAVEVLRRLGSEEAGWIAEVVEHEEDPAGSLRRLLERQHMHRTGHTALAAVTGALAMEASHKPAVAEQLIVSNRWYREQVARLIGAGQRAGIFRDDIEASLLAGLLLAALDGVYIHRRLRYEDVDAVRDSLLSLLETPTSGKTPAPLGAVKVLR